MSITDIGGPANIMKHMKGIKFPARKDDLKQLAENNRSRAQNTDKILELIDRIPDQDYNRVSDIMREIGKVA